MDTITNKYVNKPNAITTNVFTEEYLSGSDVSIYINDNILPNVSGISYTLQEQLKPLYGYASRVYDDASVGNRIVVGTLRIPITNDNYNNINNYISNGNSTALPNQSTNYSIKYQSENTTVNNQININTNNKADRPLWASNADAILKSKGSE